MGSIADGTAGENDPAPLSDCEAWAILDTTPAMVWLGDAVGNCVFLNRALREFWGVTDVADFTWGDTLHPDDAALLAEPYGKAMAEQSALCVEARYRRADGTWRWLRTEANPRFDASGRFSGMVGVNLDVTDQREAEADLRRSRDQLEFAIEAAGAVGTWLWDIQRDEIRAEKMTWCGLDSSTGSGVAGSLEKFMSAIHPEDRSRVAEAIRATLEDGAAYRTEFRIPAPGGDRWVSASGRCERDAQGNPSIFAGLTVDVTDRRKREEETLILSRELSHRLKNAFAIIQSMVAQSAQADTAASPAMGELAGRIRALGKAHLLSLPDTIERIGNASLHELARSIVAPYCGQGGRLEWEGPDIEIRPETTTAFALIVNELATNAAKYGSLAGRGEVDISVTDRGGEVVVTWSESGGAAVVAPLREGFGSLLIRHSVESLNGEAEAVWRPEGLQWRLRLPCDGVNLRAAAVRDDAGAAGPRGLRVS